MKLKTDWNYVSFIAENNKEKKLLKEVYDSLEKDEERSITLKDDKLTIETYW
jgi:hypothetical protein